MSTAEIEQVLAAHPAVSEAAIVSGHDPELGETLVAYVVVEDPAHPPSIQELIEWCADRLTRSTRPGDITVVDTLPQTSVGKIDRSSLNVPAPETKRMRAKSPSEYGPT